MSAFERGDSPAAGVRDPPARKRERPEPFRGWGTKNGGNRLENRPALPRHTHAHSAPRRSTYWLACARNTHSQCSSRRSASRRRGRAHLTRFEGWEEEEEWRDDATSEPTDAERNEDSISFASLFSYTTYDVLPRCQLEIGSIVSFASAGTSSLSRKRVPVSRRRTLPCTQHDVWPGRTHSPMSGRTLESWVGHGEPTTASGASWSLLGQQLGYSLVGQAVAVLTCGAQHDACVCA